MLFRKSSAIAASALVLLVASGCAAGDSKGGDTSSAGASAAQQTGQTRTIKDIDGTEVKIPENPQRIADLWHANNQMVLLLGGQDKLAATTQSIQKLPWFKQVDPGIAKVPAPVKGTDVNMEELLKTNPDVVLASDTKQIEEARSAGLPAVHVDFQNFADLKKTLDITAEVLGTQDAKDRAQRYEKYLDGNIAEVQDRLKNLKDSDKPKVLHIADASDLTKVDGSNSLIGEWMKTAGATNSIDGVKNLQNITTEQMIASKPDYIIIGGTKSKEGVEKIEKDPAWADVPAVKNHRVLQNPVGTFNWDRYSAEEALQVLWAAKTFHPDQFKDVDLVSETQKFYKDYYGYDLSTEDAKRIIAGQSPASK